MSRPAIAHIRLDAFRQNYRQAKRIHGGKALAVVKANAYGHGAVQCAQAIADEADGYAVATIEEALSLRETGIRAPILLLEGFFESEELPLVATQSLWIVVHHLWQVEMLLATKLDQSIQVWLKLDTGMHRLGLSPSEYLNAYTRLLTHQNISKIVLMSHFANADNLESFYTLEQIVNFHNVHSRLLLAGCCVETSLANSSAILGWKGACSDWSRPGIMLYGANPLLSNANNSIVEEAHNMLHPVMQLTSKIISIQKIKKGDAIGYGQAFTAQQDTILGIVACGYADGYPRSAVSGTPVAVGGKVTRLIGRVSMDMLFVDLTYLPEAKIGSVVELWGEQINANEVAKNAGTIAYELFCNTKRVEFQYYDESLLT